MRVKSLLAITLFTACETGESAPQIHTRSKARVPISAKQVVVPPGISVTPMQMIAIEPVPATETAAPFTLTASDGSGLALTRIDAKAVVQGPLAFGSPARTSASKTGPTS